MRTDAELPYSSYVPRCDHRLWGDSARTFPPVRACLWPSPHAAHPMTASHPPFRIVACHTPDLLSDFRRLCEQYAASLPFSLCFQGFDEEMRSLPGSYSPPRGAMYLAIAESAGSADDRRLVAGAGGTEPDAVGCIAMRPIEADACEMKRLFVMPGSRGAGIARALATTLITQARTIGYRQMKLDTSGDMLPAQRLYESLGFRPADRYNDDPMEDTLYYALDLAHASAD